MKKYSLFAISIAVLAAGCGKSGPSLNGDWTVTASKSMPPGATMTATMSDPDVLKMVVNIKQDIPGSGPVTIVGAITGTYKLAGENMTMLATDVKFTGSGFPESIKKMADAQMASMGEGLKKQINEGGVTKFKWVNDDSFTLTGKNGTPETFTRKK